MTSRVIECACGSRFETLEKITGRLPHATSKQVGSSAYVVTDSSLIATGDHGRPRMITGDQGSLSLAVTGGLGGLISGSSLPSPSALSGLDHDLILAVTPIRGRARVARTGPGQAPVEFLAFWEAYPRHVAKVAALRAWIKINPDADLIQIIMAAMTWQRDVFLGRDPEARPHASTWLNGRRWEDERPAPATLAGHNGKSERTDAAFDNWRGEAK